MPDETKANLSSASTDIPSTRNNVSSSTTTTTLPETHGRDKDLSSNPNVKSTKESNNNNCCCYSQQQQPTEHHHPLETSTAIPINTDDDNVDESLRSWLTPLDSAQTERHPILRRSLGIVEFFTLITIFCLGIYLLFTEPFNAEKWKGLFYYMIASLSADVLLAAAVGCLLFVLRLCCGEASMRHATAMCSIFLQVIQGATYYVMLGFGIYFTIIEHQELLHKPLLLTYLIIQTGISLVSTIGTLPTVFGTLRYAAEKIRHKIRRTPVVEFRTQDPHWTVQYARLGDYTSSLENMHPPRNSPDFVLVHEQTDDQQEIQPSINKKDDKVGNEIGTLGTMPSEHMLDRMGIEIKKK